jgi:hypothetical protein
MVKKLSLRAVAAVLWFERNDKPPSHLPSQEDESSKLLLEPALSE